MKKQRRNKWLSFVLALAMVVSMFNGISVPVFAEETDTTVSTESEAEQTSAVADIWFCGSSTSDVYENVMDYENKVCTVYVPDYTAYGYKMRVQAKEGCGTVTASMSCTAAYDNSAVTDLAITTVTDPTSTTSTSITRARSPLTNGFGTGEMSVKVTSSLGTENWTVKLLRSASLTSGSAAFSVKAGTTTIALATTHQAYVYENENKTALTADSVTLTMRIYAHAGERAVTVNGNEATLGTATSTYVQYTYELDTKEDVTTAVVKIAPKNDENVRPTTYTYTFYKSNVIRHVVVDQDTINLQGAGKTATIQAAAQNSASAAVETTDYKWEIEDSSIASITVDPEDPSKAVITAVGDGLTKFKVTSAGISAEGIVLSEVNKKVDVLSDIAIASTSSLTSTSAVIYDVDIDSEKRVITAYIPVGTTAIYIYPTIAEGKLLTEGQCTCVSYSDANVTVDYNASKGYFQISTTKVPYVSQSIMPGNDITMVLTPQVGETETWTIKTVRETTISNISIVAGDSSTVTLSSDFSVNTKEYSTKVSTDVKTLTFTITPVLTTKDAEGVYNPLVKVNGEKVAYDAESNTATYTMNATEGTKKLVFTVEAENITVPREYVFDVTVVAPTQVTFATVPENAIVNLTDANGVHQNSKNKVYGLISGSYTYTVTAPGYKAVTGTLTVGSEAITQKVELEKAPESDELKQLESEWPQYNRNTDNNAITSAATPTQSDAVAVKWQNAIGTEVSNSSQGQSIIVNDKIYMASGSMLLVADKDTGDLIMSQKMSAAVGYQYMSPVYGDGMIFVGQSGGVEAFNADTLEPLWRYTHSLGGSMRSQMRYDDGYLYTGFYTGDSGSAADAHWVCIDVTDEDPEITNEAKVATWSIIHRGGFFWAGCWTNEKYLFLTSDDDGDSYSTDYTSILYCIDKKTGDVIQTIDIPGAVRGGVTYYEGRIYFTTTVGYLYSFNITENGQGIIDTENLIEPLIVGGRSTNTPVIYNYRLYFSSAAGSVGNQPDAGIHVIDIDKETGKLTFAYNVATGGNCQGSGILSTAYEATTGYVYVYFTQNNSLGSIYVVKDKAGLTEADPESGVLWTPSPSQYCIHRLFADEDGILYYNNDKGTMYALESTYLGLTGMTAEGGNAVIDEGKDFDTSASSHNVIVDNGTEKVPLTFKTAEGAEVWIDDKTVQGSYEAVLTDGTATVKVKIVNGNNARVYTINIRERSNDADLHALVVTESDTYEENSNLTPALSADVTAYANDYASNLTTVYVWPEANELASMEVTAGDGVEAITASTDGSFYAVTIKEGARTSVVKIKVTAEQSSVTKEYTLTLNAREYPLESITLDRTNLKLDAVWVTEGVLNATLNPQNTTDTDPIVWTTSDEKVATVTVDEANAKSATVKAVSDGTATITVTMGKISATATVVVDMTAPEVFAAFDNRTAESVDMTLRLSESGFYWYAVQKADAEAPTSIWDFSSKQYQYIESQDAENGIAVTIEGLTADEYVIYFGASDGRNDSDVIAVPIPTYVALESITADKTEAALTAANNTVDVTITLNPETTSENPTITWTSSDEKVAVAAADEKDSKKAVITATGDGTATITATAGSFTASITVTCDITPVEVTAEDVSIENRTDTSADMVIKTAEACTITYVVGGEVPVDAAAVLNNESAKTVVITEEDLEAGKTEAITGLTMDAVNVYMVTTDNVGNISDVVTILISGNYPFGDVNHDGRVSVQDASYILAMIRGEMDVDLELADLNGDGKVSVQDASIVLAIIRGEY